MSGFFSRTETVGPISNEQSVSQALRPLLADRFWSVCDAPHLLEVAPHSERDAELASIRTAAHAAAILSCFFAADQSRGTSDGATLTTLSLSTLLHQQEMAGDLRYASPEQREKTSQLTETSLVFSVGVLLFEKVCGVHPFSNDRGEVDGEQANRAELGQAINVLCKQPIVLRNILLRALSRSRSARYDTLQDLHEALLGYVFSSGVALGGDLPMFRPRAETNHFVDSVGDQIELLAQGESRPNPLFFRRDVPTQAETPTALAATRRRAASTAVEVPPPRRSPKTWLTLSVGFAAGIAIGGTVMVWKKVSPDRAELALTNANPPYPLPPATSSLPSASSTNPLPPATPSLPSSSSLSANSFSLAPSAESTPRSPSVSSAGANSPATDDVASNSNPTATDKLPSSGSPSQTTTPSNIAVVDPNTNPAFVATTDCFSAEQKQVGLSFSFSVVTGSDSLIQKIYFPGEAELEVAEEACVHRHLRDEPGGLGPQKVARYHIRIQASQLTVRTLATRSVE